ncbi:hypothetical protein KAFR_0J02410 [Kazachstania africana CBS 2517]|uniref:Inheritance of peroxisomes protein 1 n=1 Tax=Kazachstania africana (strain ATCC 22294 / BCRC 22015 / CBS 2517 / CECT 1963 / NBRC 1671 / NRRL Y-8276) TaxID=1071382 RepID=H2B105_KAZAF|nr:hypothetical protein KAFR_0J02410 [Kazachstania africana CBS 2517]CCF60305.1 hypothetical protein KAFR_0J02410 [Kazachstania africana CBS 2517]
MRDANNRPMSVDSTPTKSTKLQSIRNSLKLSHKNPNLKRSSAQKNTLFKYDNVKVTSLLLNQNSKSLLCRGPIEIYEIRTKSSCSKFMSIGRSNNVIHPLLPKLKISKPDSRKFKYLMFFFNPDRIWEIEFLNIDKCGKKNSYLREVGRDFENVVSRICEFVNSAVTDVKTTILGSSISNEEGQNGASGKEEEEEKDDDELNYLLEDELNAVPNSGAVSEQQDHETIINEAFKRAINKVIPSWHALVAKQHEINVRKRASLYIPTFQEKQIARRSISVLSDYETLVSFKDLKL